MRLWRKTLAISLLASIIAIGSYCLYLWATYIDESIIVGEAYGFAIDSSKPEALVAAGQLQGHPDVVVYVSYGQLAGGNFTTAPSSGQLGLLQAHDQWDVLLDGEGKFFNSICLTFQQGHLVQAHRHRQHFELP